MAAKRTAQRSQTSRKKSPELKRSPRRAMTNPLDFLKASWNRFSEARAAGRGAAISFYAVTAIVPILLIVILVAGFAIGRDTASNALYGEFETLLGQGSGDFFRHAITGASSTTGGIATTMAGVVTLIFTASGVFLELEEALNAIWEAKPREDLAAFARARAISLGLVIALAFLLMISLVIDALLAGLSGWINATFPFGRVVLLIISQVLSLALLSAMFAGIMKYLPKTRIAWRDVIPGATFTGVLFILGKFLIGLYLRHSTTISVLGEAGTLLALLFWIYYTSQIFLFGAACTRIVAERREGLSPPKHKADRVAAAPTQPSKKA